MFGKNWKDRIIAFAEYFDLVERVEPKTTSEVPEDKGYSQQAESLGNFLINSLPDGRGVFIFDPNATTLPQWPFVKVAGLTSHKEDISLLYRSIDYAMNLGKENMLALLSVPLASNGSFDVEKTFVLAYHVRGEEVFPYTTQESDRVKADIVSIQHTSFKTGERWSFDPAHVPSCPSLVNSFK